MIWLTEFHRKWEDSNQDSDRKEKYFNLLKLSSKCLGLKHLLDMGACFLKAGYDWQYKNGQCEWIKH